MSRSVWFLFVVAVPACAPCDSTCSPDPPDAGGLAGGTETRVISVADDGTRAEIRDTVAPARIAGRYYVGDGLGYNLSLDLRPDGSFECTWRGCLGKYGTTAGSWTLDSDGVAVTTAMSDGMFANRPLGRLRAVRLRGHYLLVEESHLDLFESIGPHRGTCLHQEAAKPAIEAEYMRRINEAVRRAGQPGPKAELPDGTAEPRGAPDRAGKK